MLGKAFLVPSIGQSGSPRCALLIEENLTQRHFTNPDFHIFKWFLKYFLEQKVTAYLIIFMNPVDVYIDLARQRCS